MSFILRLMYRQRQSRYIQRLWIQMDFEKVLGAEDMRQCRIRNRAFLKRLEIYA